MKKLLLLSVALLSGMSLVFAQQPADSTAMKAVDSTTVAADIEKDPLSHAGRFFVSLQGGPVLNIYENAFSYRENGQTLGLFKLQGALALGYDFSDSFGVRLAGAFGSDAGACNTRQTSAHGFYPYTFKHVNAFVDALLNLNGLAGRITYFRPKLYAGLGGAHTFGYNFINPHPWQKVTTSNTVFGFRLGFLAEYTFDSGLGFFGDLCGEGYTDMYNGLMPGKDETGFEGYGGFPLDLRGLLTFGVVYHF